METYLQIEFLQNTRDESISLGEKVHQGSTDSLRYGKKPVNEHLTECSLKRKTEPKKETESHTLPYRSLVRVDAVSALGH